MAGCSIFGITLEGAAPARRTPTRTAYATRTPRPALSPMPTWTPAQRALQTATMPAQRATSPAATQRTPQPGTQAAPPTATQATPQQAQRPTQAPAVATPKPTSTPSLLTSVDEITNAVNAGLHGIPFRITISEQEIGDAISVYLQSTPDVAFSDLQVSLVPGQALVTGKVRALGFNLGFKAATTVVVEGGKPRLKVLKLDLLGGLIPGFVKSQIIQMVEQSADLPVLNDLPVTVANVDIQQDEAIVTGKLN